MHKNDLAFLLSGGVQNTDPTKSLGGSMSHQVIQDKLDNLFNDVTRAHAVTGFTDYRCFYLVNNSPDEKLQDFSVYVHKGLSGCEISLGLNIQNEVQALMILGSPINGHFQLKYTIQQGTVKIVNRTSEINWTSNTTTMAQNIAALLNGMDHLSGVQCMGQQTSGGYDFLITFAGDSGGRTQEVLEIIHAEGITAQVVRVTQGGPINLAAPNIGIPNNAPSGVTFYNTDNATPVKIGTFFPQDFIPIWLRRITPKQVIPVHPDKFRFFVLGTAKPGNVTIKKHTPDTKTPTTTKKNKKMLF